MNTPTKWIIGIIALVLVVWGITVSNRKQIDENAEPIKIGQISARSGVGAAIGEEEYRGALLAIEEINDDGGILGRPLELISEDLSLDKINTAGSIAQKLTTIDMVTAIVGPQWDEPTLAIAEIIEANKTPVVSPNVTHVVEQTKPYPYLFSTWYSNEVGVREVLEFAQKQGWKRIVIVQPASFGFWELVTGYFEKHAASYGITIVHKDFGVDLLSTDYRTLILKAKQSNPDAIFGSFAEYECPFLRQASEMGLNVPLLSTESAGTPEALKNCSDILPGNLFYSTPAETSHYKEFSENYLARFGALPVSPTAVTAYEAVRVIAEAITSAGSTEREAVRNAIAEINLEDGVALPTVTFDENGYLVTPEDAFTMMTVADGKFVPVK